MGVLNCEYVGSIKFDYNEKVANFDYPKANIYLLVKRLLNFIIPICALFEQILLALTTLFSFLCFFFKIKNKKPFSFN